MGGGKRKRSNGGVGGEKLGAGGGGAPVYNFWKRIGENANISRRHSGQS